MKTKRPTLACLLILLLFFPLSTLAAGDGQVQYDLGVFALDEGNLAAAETHFKAAVRQAPENPYYHHLLGKTYLKNKQSEAAIASLEAAWKLNPALTGLQYDLAMAYYEAGRYPEAEKHFADLAAKDQSNVLARYYLGMTYFNQDRYGRALPPLLSAGDENASIRDNSWYFAGISHYKSDEPEKALEKLGYVETRAASEKLRASARQWQDVIRSNQARSARHNLYLKLGFEYDDNVRLDPLDQDLFADEGDFVASAYFAWKYKMINTLKRKMGVGYSHYMTRYNDLSQFDLTAGVVSLFYQERLTQKLYLSFRYNPSQYWLDNDHYLFRQQLGPTLLYRFSDRMGVRLTYDFVDNAYYTDKGRDGRDHDFSLDFFSQLLNRKGDLTVGAVYGNRSAEHPDYEYDLLRARFEFSYTLPAEVKLAVKGSWGRRDYDNIHSVHNRQRQDDRYSGGLQLSRSFFYKWLTVQAEYRYTRNDSNISYYSYEKNVTGLSLIAKF